LASTGLPLWVWIVIAAVIVLLLVWAVSRRRPKQTIIKTRLG
jgi:Flp pilus assembly protein TadB